MTGMSTIRGLESPIPGYTATTINLAGGSPMKTNADKELARQFILAAKKAAHKHGMRKADSGKKRRKAL